MIKFMFTAALLGMAASVFSQSLVSEKQIPLSKEQRKNEPEGAIYSSASDGVMVYFESSKAKKEKGQKRSYKRFELNSDKDLNVTDGDYVTLGTKNAVKPRLYFKDFRIGYTSWVDEDEKTDMMIIQLIKFDKANKIVEVKDIEVCTEREFSDYQIVSNNGNLVLLVQYESKAKETKNLDFVKYYKIDASTLEVKSESDLNLLGRDEFGIESMLAVNNSIYLVGKQLQRIKPFKFKLTKDFILFKLSSDGKEEGRTTLGLPSGYKMAGVQLTSHGNDLVLAGEYAPSTAQPMMKSYPANNKSVKVNNSYIGMFVSSYSLDNLTKGITKVYDYEKDIMKKLRKGNPGFSKKGGSFVLNDFMFLPDGSFYIAAEMFVKYWRTTVTKGEYVTTYNYYTDFSYKDAVIYKFTKECELDWVHQIDRDAYTRTYGGHLKADKPIDRGKLDPFLLDNNSLAVLYNTPGGKYGKKRFGLSGITIKPDGTSNEVVDFN
ncbi:MAG: hypothetical protein LH615_05670, partial [Ferruginibacter sp.]|nr:hypothetical protein [Ferruginibacter sp.]